MKIKKNTYIETSDFWYDLFEGGYIDPNKILEDENELKKVLEAIAVLTIFKNAVEDIIEYI